jgi:thiosulfate reductase cytochrome b subunit
MSPETPSVRILKDGRRLVRRHSLLVRAAHWLNLLAMGVLLFSGLQILCAHPAFYWGEDSRFAAPAAAIVSDVGADGEARGRLIVGPLRLATTGFLGASKAAGGELQPRAFPSWLTLPSELDLGAGRRWHFFFAWVFVLNGLVYLLHGVLTGRFGRELWPARAQWRSLGPDLLNHLRLRFPRDETALTYGLLQRLAYAPVVFGALPLMVLTGLAMSPGVDARLHWLPMLLGGRQSARTLHFLSLLALLLFLVAHVGMTLLAGPARLLRAMIDGRVVLKPQESAP